MGVESIRALKGIRALVQQREPSKIVLQTIESACDRALGNEQGRVEAEIGEDYDVETVYEAATLDEKAALEEPIMPVECFLNGFLQDHQVCPLKLPGCQFCDDEGRRKRF